ncbi:PREDICTED: protein argonaute-2-like, partial [Rhagoletis zephyria]|uniref:protein argonaute-2-like n=1 Tax=Rhagoletis zephyria TaxID=28612 RepID=UPI0008117AA4
MVIGVDVNHPGETERVMSSVAAAVGSYDQSFALYNASIRVQAKQRDETIKQLDLMVGDLLRQYKDARRELPSTLVVFRDGVSEGQFARVVDVEIPLIRRACAELGAPNLPFVLIVVQKRHHTRFALAEQNTSGRKPTYNVPSGTVVDRDIVDPTLKSFYLNSHFSPL